MINVFVAWCGSDNYNSVPYCSLLFLAVTKKPTYSPCTGLMDSVYTLQYFGILFVTMPF